MPAESDRERRQSFVLALLRILMGALFITVWAENLRKDLYTPDGYRDFVTDLAEQTDVTWYGDFILDVVAPNAALFAYGQLVLESVVMGLFLLAGFLVPVSALIAAGFSTNLLLASWGVPGEWQGTYVMMIAILLAVAIGQAGRTLGVDARLARKNPKPRLPVY
jgi:uncharacterized membrane protein YphA (DoxX/SURF4 family)